MIFLRFLWNEDTDEFNVAGVHSISAATEKARLPRFSQVLGKESCSEIDDLSMLS